MHDTLGFRIRDGVLCCVLLRTQVDGQAVPQLTELQAWMVSGKVFYLLPFTLQVFCKFDTLDLANTSWYGWAACSDLQAVNLVTFEGEAP